MSKIKYYVESMRLRTLPLAVAGIIMGGILAAKAHYWSLEIFLWALLTAVFLQILSNVANELGDLQKGTDNEYRLGPIRSVQRGKLTQRNLLNMLFLFVGLSIIAGLGLVWTAFESFFYVPSVLVFFLGGTAIVAAIKYTYGKKSYGYMGLGDLFVFLFFGVVSVSGTYFLMTKSLACKVLLPASAIGCLSSALLNLNNMRDIVNDTDFQKKTLVVRMGLANAKKYHGVLILSAFVFMSVYALLSCVGFYGYLYLLTLPFFIVHLNYILKNEGKDLDKHMKVISLFTIAFSLLSGVGLLTDACSRS